MRERERQRHREREKQAHHREPDAGEAGSIPCREPDVGLDPKSPGPHPGLKAALGKQYLHNQCNCFLNWFNTPYTYKGKGKIILEEREKEYV